MFTISNTACRTNSSIVFLTLDSASKQLLVVQFYMMTLDKVFLSSFLLLSYSVLKKVNYLSYTHVFLIDSYKNKNAYHGEIKSIHCAAIINRISCKYLTGYTQTRKRKILK